MPQDPQHILPANSGLFFILLVAVVIGGSACSGSGLRMREVPANGYEHTLNYKFQAQVYSDDNGRCQRMVVRVRPINKVYWKKPPPDRLQLFDDDCLTPVRFERIQYLSRERKGMERLSGPQVAYFWSENFRLQDELISWIWREDVLNAGS